MYKSPYSQLTEAMLSDELKEAMSYEQTVEQLQHMLSKSDRARRIALYEAAVAERKRQTQIRQQICPKCEGKLTRGKKNKHNGYKREWLCNECFELHTI